MSSEDGSGIIGEDDANGGKREKVGFAYLVLAPFLVGTGVEASSYLNHFPVFLSQGLRYGVGAVILLFISRRRLGKLSLLGLRDWLLVGLLSLTGLYGFSVAMVEAVRSSSPTAVGIVIGCAPILIALISEAFNRRLPSKNVLFGAIVVTASTAVVQGFGQFHFQGLLWSLLALVCDSLYSVLSAPLVVKVGPSPLAFITNIIAALTLILTQLLFYPIALISWTLQDVLAISYLGVFVSAVAFIYWYKGITKVPVHVAGLFVGFIPIGSFLSQAIMGVRTVSQAEVLGTVGVIIGIALGVLPKPNHPRSARCS